MSSKRTVWSVVMIDRFNRFRNRSQDVPGGRGQHSTPRMILSASIMPGIREPLCGTSLSSVTPWPHISENLPSGVTIVTEPVPFWTDS